MSTHEQYLHDSITELPVVGALYRHYKGGIYSVTGSSIDVERGKYMVLYKKYNDPNVNVIPYARLLSNWLSKVDIVTTTKAVDGEVVMSQERGFRFTRTCVQDL